MFNWSMNSKCREQNSWAQYETELYPSFQYEISFNSVWIEDISYYDGILYMASYDTADNVTTTIYAFDFITGSQEWSFEIPNSRGYSGFTPTLNDSMVFCGAYHADRLYALDRYTGNQIWDRDIGCYSPVLDGDRLYLFTDSLYCLDIRDGSNIWSAKRTDFEFGTPAVDDSNFY